jgi:Kef-type K+ transport system membrane component KefB
MRLALNRPREGLMASKFGSIVLTFLAGIEVDPSYLRRRLGPSLAIGVASFAGPFLVAPFVAFFVLGTISSLYGLNAGIIDKTQFSLLVTVVVLSAVVPTAIAERWFLPDAERERRLDRRLAAVQSEEYV